MKDHLDLKRVHFDPEYLDDLRDPLRGCAGIATMVVIAIIFWGCLIVLVWMANLLI